MLRCVARRTCWRACWRLHAPTHPSRSHGSPPVFARYASRSTHRYQKTIKPHFPVPGERRNPDAWTDLLEGGLPPQLRDHDRPRTDLTPNAADVAEVLLGAQRLTQPSDGIDLLFYLGFQKGRWDAVIWLVKLLVGAFEPQVLKPSRSQNLVGQWTVGATLDEITRYKGALLDSSGPEAVPITSSAGSATLNQLTGDKPDNLSEDEVLAHNALGQIWRSLGHMVTACVDTELKPEILEIIAYLHHMGIMPGSIYNQKPSSDATSIQQPPTLNLLSSRILISLSDAAWRAHERGNANAAQAQTGWHQSYRLNQPGSRYRVNVAGLRPEVWLELLLWSCLHGGWIMEGTEILRALYASGWKPFSWRTVIPYGNGSNLDWDTLEYAFNTRLQSTMDRPDTDVQISVHKTISSEVINAYVDALASSTRLGVGERGLSPNYVISKLHTMQKLLELGGLPLVAGSWDAILLRLADTHEEFIDQSLASFKSLATFSPTMGAELDFSVGRDTPAYVFDGSAAVIGLYHRALRSRINAGDFTGSFQLFQWLQEMADANKSRSMEDFIQHQRLSRTDSKQEEAELFTSNFSGISYPAFEMQIPSTILGPFLDVVIDAKAFPFARWLVYSKEIDGPVIPERLYDDPAVAPALIRLASETDDRSLLSKVVDARRPSVKDERPFLPQEYLRMMFRSQVERGRWSSAAKIVKHMQEMPHSAALSMLSVAYVIRAMLFDSDKASASSGEKSEKGSNDARDLFTVMLGVIDQRKGSEIDREGVNLLLIVLSHADGYWAEFCKPLRRRQIYYTFNIPTEAKSRRSMVSYLTKAFNIVLEGIIQIYGAGRGQKVLDAFWPSSIEMAQQKGRRTSGLDAGHMQMSRFRPFGDDTDLIRNVIRLPTNPPEDCVVYDGLRPDLGTIRMVFRACLKDFEDDAEEKRKAGAPGTSESLFACVAWTVHKLRSVGMAENDIMQELNAALAQHDMSRFASLLPDMLLDIKSEKDDEDT